jgi:hypothetical protein
MAWNDKPSNPDSATQKAAFRIIMGPNKGMKVRIADFAFGLTEIEISEATTTFHRQGSTLWRYWCDGVRKAKKAGHPVPSPFND